jgi:hypothetical protein
MNELLKELKATSKPYWGQQGGWDQLKDYFPNMGRKIRGYPLAQFIKTPQKDHLTEILEAHADGEILEFDWHTKHPAFKGYKSISIPREECSIAKYLPALKPDIDRIISSIFLPLKERGINVMFRPFHESSGGWFWWGVGKNTVNTGEDVANAHKWLYSYLKERGCDNVVYVWNVNIHQLKTKEKGLANYPGKAFCDILSIDCYGSLADVDAVIKEAIWLKELAIADDKPLALSEFGISMKDNPYGIMLKSKPDDIPGYWERLEKFCSNFGFCYIRTWFGRTWPPIWGWVPVRGRSPLEDQSVNEFIEFINRGSVVTRTVKG